MIKFALRQLWRQKFFSLLHILGLAIGIAGSFCIFRIIDFELLYDKHIPQANQIYQLVSRSEFEGKESGFGGVPLPVAKTLIDAQIAGLEAVVPVYLRYYDHVKINGEKSNITPSRLISTLSSYFDVIPYEWLAGSKKEALSEPNQVVLTASRAKEYFPKEQLESIIGKSLVYNDSLVFHVSGIVQDPQYPSSFNYGMEFFTVPSNEYLNEDWGSLNSNYTLFIKVQNEKIGKGVSNFITEKSNIHTKSLQETFKYSSWYSVLPLPEKHFEPQYATGDRTIQVKTLYTLTLVGSFLLLLACINYINLTTAQLPKRAKEIGVRKTLGAGSKSIIWQFLSETSLVILMALFLSIPLISLFNYSFSDFIPEEVQHHIDYQRYGLILLLLVLLMTVISGIYPAYLATKVKTVDVLKSKIKLSPAKGLNLRRILIVFQFSIAQIFIICMLIMSGQLKYSMTADVGFTYQNLVTLNIPYQSLNTTDPHTFKESLLKHPEITQVSLGHLPMSSSMLGNNFSRLSDTGQVRFSTNMKFIDEDYIPLYQMRLVAGNIFKDNESSKSVIFNETVLYKFGFKNAEEAIGQHIYNSKNEALEIKAVIRDFNNFSFHSTIPPTILLPSADHKNYNNITVKFADTDFDKGLKVLEREWKKIYPQDPFNYEFYDQSIGKLYEADKNTSRLINFSAFITLFISCIGIFGLVTLFAYQRTKEIGIRKVLGASSNSLLILLTKEFILLVSIAFIIATPIAFQVMQNWMKENFTFYIDITWSYFAIALLISVLIALITVSIQAWRTIRLKPVLSLRDE